MESPATPAVEQQAPTRRLRILAEKPAADAIAAVVAKLPADVQEWTSDKIIFIWPPRGDSCCFSFAIDAEAVGDRIMVYLAPWTADCPPPAQMAVIATEIARAFINPPERTNEPRTGPCSTAGNLAGETNVEIQRLANSWGLWK